MNVNKLKGKIVESGKNVEKIAEEIGIDRGTFYRKLNDSDKFTIKDIKNISVALNLGHQDMIEIFLS